MGPHNKSHTCMHGIVEARGGRDGRDTDRYVTECSDEENRKPSEVHKG